MSGPDRCSATFHFCLMLILVRAYLHESELQNYWKCQVYFQVNLALFFKTPPRARHHFISVIFSPLLSAGVCGVAG